VTRDAVISDEPASVADQALELAGQIARELAFLDGTAAADLDGGDLAAFVTTAEQMIARHSTFASAYRTFLAASLNQSGRMPGTLYSPPRFTDDLSRGDRSSC
jgi:DNA-binding ferritin-like protein (Dps family)